MVKVFTYDTPPGGHSLAGIAEDAFAAFNDHPRDDKAAGLAGSTGSGACARCRSPESCGVARGDVASTAA